MEVLIYESSDIFMRDIVEKALTDNKIPCTIVGGADTGLAGSNEVKIFVSSEYEKEAREIVTAFGN